MDIDRAPANGQQHVARPKDITLPSADLEYGPDEGAAYAPFDFGGIDTGDFEELGISFDLGGDNQKDKGKHKDVSSVELGRDAQNDYSAREGFDSFLNQGRDVSERHSMHEDGGMFDGDDFIFGGDGPMDLNIDWNDGVPPREKTPGQARSDCKNTPFICLSRSC